MVNPPTDVDSSPAVQEICDNVYDITWHAKNERENGSNWDRLRSYLFDFDDDVPTLIDTCMPGRVDQLIEGIDRLGIPPERLLISHKHPDHIGGIDKIGDRYDVEIWVHEDEDNINGDRRAEVETRPDHFFTHKEVIGRFEAVHVPGHTPGNSVFIDETDGIAVLADTMSGADRRGLPAGYLLHPPQSTHGFQPAEAAIAAEENLVRLLDYDFDLALVNHGTSVFESASEKIYNYVNYEPGYTDPERGVHNPNRESAGMEYFEDTDD